MLNEALNSETYENLEKLAYQMSKSFCYGCYQEVKGKYCSSCHSDDNMRLVEGVGVEYGIEWVIEHIIADNCKPLDEDFAHDSLASCYEETVKIGWIEYDLMSAIKILDPISYRIALDEYVDGLKEDHQIVEVGGEDYWVSDLESFIEENLEEVA